MPAFIAPALPLTARRAARAATTPRVPAMALSRRAFSLAAVSAAIAAVTRPDRAAAAVKDLAATDVKTAEGAKVLTALVAAGIKRDPSIAATLLRLAVRFRACFFCVCALVVCGFVLTSFICLCVLLACLVSRFLHV